MRDVDSGHLMSLSSHCQHLGTSRMCDYVDNGHFNAYLEKP
jgi:hypothetical protein